ncbi:winged helix-turn-helix domain-containing protein [Enterococcus wangshanyuanii]|uniref:OmpR/PhoB-type domain-containing protein n=1 Tax=Enterococcus wangshanyuanii TaxID=2005703 RepID=A0ABQ1PUR5_9ENTE|nr:winged helix-turn-helix domain-containing protein [Enterococcus wangshanyuanii]GGD04582.1 hypothetical protein GCM10011573_37630 [Enterococcus wangshanyuanii]
MYKVGIFSSENSDQHLMEIMNKNGYESVIIQDEQRLKDLDVLLLERKKDKDFAQIIEYIVQKKKYNIPFIWIISSTLPEQERNLYLRLGVNGIINRTDSMKEVIFTLDNNMETKLLNDNKESTLNHDKVKNKKTKLLVKERTNSIQFEGEEEIFLTKKEFTLFWNLYKNPNKPISYKELKKLLWGDDKTEDIYRVANVLFLLRKKLPPQYQDMLRTIRGVGYMLVL